MTSMSTRCRYGLRLMVALARGYGDGTTLLRHVSQQENVSEKYLGQIILPLKSAGLVSSRRGARGGYALARAPETITVKDVVQAIEGRIAAAPCVQDPEACARVGSCTAAAVWRALSEDVERSLDSFTLSALAAQGRDLAPSAPDYQI